MQPRENEWQLVLFTILTQMAVGTFTFWGLAALLVPTPDPFSEGLYPLVLLAVVLTLLASGTLSAGLHLGRPSLAVFSISNLHRSWLSREALLGGGFGLIGLILLIRRGLGSPYSALDEIFILAGVICGLVLVYGISRLYMLRTVPAWNNFGTPATFFMTTFLLGTVAMTMVWLGLAFWDDAYAIDLVLNKVVVISTVLILLFAAIQLGIFTFEVLYLNSLGGAAADSIRLLGTDLGGILIWRCVTAFVGVGVLVIKLIIWLPPLSFSFAFGLILVSEILGRFLFYGFYRREGF